LAWDRRFVPLLLSWVVVVGLYLFPNASMENLKARGIIGYLFAGMAAIGECSVLLTLLLVVFVGLLKMRKEIR
jgi:hypothetical protein